MRNIKIADGIYEVGVTDWNVRNFHGYSTNRGSTYNSYLILDEKITLIDTVKDKFADEFIRNISNIIDLEKIDYIVVNHVEPDHSGALPKVVAAAPNATIITSDPNGVTGIASHYSLDVNIKAVKSGDEISLGKRSLSFVQTPMVHWPDNMVTYCKEDKILFSNDSFGQHLASASKFDDENDFSIIMSEAKKYYANIVMPYSMQVRKALEIVETLDINIIAPSHGVIFRKYVKDIIEKYKYFSNDIQEKRALIIYDSMWNSTEKMAKAIADGFNSENVPASLFDLKVHHISDIITDVLKAEYIIVGSPTLNNNIMPTVSAFLTYLKGLAPKNKKSFAFGSFGWGGQSIGIVNDELTKFNFDMILDPIKVKYIPTLKQLDDIQNKVKKAIAD